MLSTTEVHVELTTPCFLGGASPSTQTEWRGASIRGQLHWWLRAVAGGVFGGDIEETKDLDERLLGSVNRASSIVVRPTRSPVDFYPVGSEERLGSAWDGRRLAGSWSDPSAETEARLELRNGASNPLLYLAFGCIAPAHGMARFTRPAFKPGQRAAFHLVSRRPFPAPDAARLRAALWAWLNLGGIGAKSRRGFGSLGAATAAGPLLEGFDLAPATPDDFEAQARRVLECTLVASPALPEWSHFSRDARIYIAAQHPGGAPTWVDAMSSAGGWLIAFRRRYGSRLDKRVRGRAPLSGRDYAWAAPKGWAPRSGIPDRAGFGLPLPFGRDGETVTRDPPGDHRRASPLLIHISRFGGGCLPVFTYIPSRFVPDGDVLGFRSGARPSAPPSTEQLGIVQEFLSDLERKGLIRRVWP